MNFYIIYWQGFTATFATLTQSREYISQSVHVAFQCNVEIRQKRLTILIRVVSVFVMLLYKNKHDPTEFQEDFVMLQDIY